MWRKTIDFSKEMKKKGIDLNFTYFISGVYLIPKHQKKLYNLSFKGAGVSNIDFGDSVSVTDERVNLINEAFDNGHEIASHLNGHFDGTYWNEEEWKEEISFFNNIVDNTLENKLDRNIKIKISSKDIVGIRTPLLGTNKNLYKVLNKIGFKYDSSKIRSINRKEEKKGRVVIYPLRHILVNNKKTISMDYNIFLSQTEGENKLKKGTREWEEAKKNILNGYNQYFKEEYNGKRKVVNIANHFSLWNDGLYWEAMKDFSESKCSQKDVVCTSYKNTLE